MALWENPWELTTDELVRFLRSEHVDHAVGDSYSNGVAVVDGVYNEIADRLERSQPGDRGD